jgi:hypothetical protein
LFFIAIHRLLHWADANWLNSSTSKNFAGKEARTVFATMNIGPENVNRDFHWHRCGCIYAPLQLKKMAPFRIERTPS